jgi:hypothetical protein
MKNVVSLAILLIASLATFSQSPPKLVSPTSMQEMDNGCIDRSNGLEWDFEWQPVDGASRYQIWVKSDGAPIAAINGKTVRSTSYQHRSPQTYIAGHRTAEWSWRVRARVGSKWTEWSDAGKFQIEPLNTDCPVPIVDVASFIE